MGKFVFYYTLAPIEYESGEVEADTAEEAEEKIRSAANALGQDDFEIIRMWERGVSREYMVDPNVLAERLRRRGWLCEPPKEQGRETSS